MDDDNASFRQVVVDLQELYGKKIAPLHLPIRENGQFVGYVNAGKRTEPLIRQMFRITLSKTWRSAVKHY